VKKLGKIAADAISIALCRNRRNLVVRILDRVALRLHRGLQNQNYDQHTNGESDVLRKIAQHEPKCVFDVGANHGDWAKLAHTMFPAAAIHCFEIAPPTFQKLTSAISGLDRIRANNFGLSDQSGKWDVHYDPHQDGLTSGIRIVCASESSRIAARVTTGDEYAFANEITVIDFLKIDVEGMEDKVLRGFESCLDRKAIKIIQFEYGLVNIASHFLLSDFYEFLKKYGFIIGKIYPRYVDFRDYEFQHEDFIGPNYLAVLKEDSSIIKLLS
jgi:FkbM family methyltransferase